MNTINTIDDIRQLFIKAAIDGDLTIEKMLRFPEGSTILLNRGHIETLIDSYCKERERRKEIEALQAFLPTYEAEKLENETEVAILTRLVELGAVRPELANLKENEDEQATSN